MEVTRNSTNLINFVDYIHRNKECGLKVYVDVNIATRTFLLEALVERAHHLTQLVFMPSFRKVDSEPQTRLTLLYLQSTSGEDLVACSSPLDIVELFSGWLFSKTQCSEYRGSCSHEQRRVRVGWITRYPPLRHSKFNTSYFDPLLSKGDAKQRRELAVNPSLVILVRE